MYSIEAFKIAVFFISFNERSLKRSTFEMLEWSLLKIFASVLGNLLKSVSLSFEKLGR